MCSTFYNINAFIPCSIDESRKLNFEWEIIHELNKILKTEDGIYIEKSNNNLANKKSKFVRIIDNITNIIVEIIYLKWSNNNNRSFTGNKGFIFMSQGEYNYLADYLADYLDMIEIYAIYNFEGKIKN